MTTGIFKEFEDARSKMDELAFSDEGRRLSAVYERLNFCREALFHELEIISDECEEAMYNYMQFIGMRLPDERIASVMQAIARNKERKKTE